MNAAVEPADRLLPPIDGDTVVDDKFWLVVCTDARDCPGGEILTRGYKFVHPTETSAEKEAARLATKYHGYAFAVVESAAIVHFDERSNRLIWEESQLPPWRRPVSAREQQ